MSLRNAAPVACGADASSKDLPSSVCRTGGAHIREQSAVPGERACARTADARDALDGVGNLAAGLLLSSAEQSVASFAEASQALMKGLEAVQQAYPFVGVVILAFKAAIELELTRRENDKKILLLKSRMIETMEVLLELSGIDDMTEVDENGKSVQGRLQLVLNGTATDIRDCSALCEKYMQKRFLVKLFDGARWERRLAAFDAIFVQRRQDISFALTIRAAHGLGTLNHAIATVQAQNQTADEDSAMLLLFSQLQSPLERELLQFIGENGGPRACAESEELFKELQSRIGPASGALNPGVEDSRALMAAIQVELQSDLNHALAEDRQNFNLKFDAVQHKLEALNNEVHHSGDRIISALKSGPHDRLLDQDMHQLWKEMAWRGSIRASQFIVAVHDYYRGKPTASVCALGRTEDGSDSAASKLSCGEMQEGWAISYITITRWRPILEAFDEDASGWISVQNVNRFTSSRPATYTVLKWIAYWSVAFRVISGRYARDIQALRAKMNRVAVDALPCNRARVQKYIANPRLAIVDYVVRSTPHDTENDPDVLGRFSDYVTSEESRLQGNLDNFHWKVDASNTLSLITGGGRLERIILPLLSLLLRRHTQLIELACKYPLHDVELYDAEISVNTLAESICNRLSTLISHFQHQNLNIRQEFTHAYNGMFSVLYAWYRKDVVDDYEYPDTDVNAFPEDKPDTNILNYGVNCFDVPEDFYNSSGDASSTSELTGSWVGQYVSTDESRHGWAALCLRTNGLEVYGSGTDSKGTFELTGTLRASADDRRKMWISLRKSYTMKGYRAVWRYDGDMAVDANGLTTSIYGQWGTWSDGLWNVPLAALGSFSLHRTCFRQRPPTSDRRHWELLKAYTEDAFRNRCTWDFLRQRRDDRNAVINAYMRILSAQEPQRYPWAWTHEQKSSWDVLKDLNQRLRPQDASFYRWLAERRLCQMFFHSNVFCASCGVELTDVRYRCLDCGDGTAHSAVDLCAQCVDRNDTVTRSGRTHSSSHAVLKTLRVLPLRDVVRVTSLAIQKLRSITNYLTELANSSNSSGPEGLQSVCCYSCHRRLQHPSWYCAECVSHTFMCEGCDIKHPPPRGGDVPESSHQWWHVVLKISVVERDVAHSQADPQLSSLVSRVTAQQEQLDGLARAVFELQTSSQRNALLLCCLHFASLGVLLCCLYYSR